MIIREASIENKSHDLDAFLKQLQGCDYVVYGSLIAFDYAGDAQSFDVNLVKQINLKFDEQTDGIVHLSSFAVAFEDINEKISLTGIGQGESYSSLLGLDVVSAGAIEKRKKKIWSIIEKQIDLPPEKIYFYENNISSDVMWGFCYIFLNNGKGIVLQVGASD